jgi:hypothetical protein
MFVHLAAEVLEAAAGLLIHLPTPRQTVAAFSIAMQDAAVNCSGTRFVAFQ